MLPQECLCDLMGGFAPAPEALSSPAGPLLTTFPWSGGKRGEREKEQQGGRGERGMGVAGRGEEWDFEICHGDKAPSVG